MDEQDDVYGTEERGTRDFERLAPKGEEDKRSLLRARSPEKPGLEPTMAAETRKSLSALRQPGPSWLLLDEVPIHIKIGNHEGAAPRRIQCSSLLLAYSSAASPASSSSSPRAVVIVALGGLCFPCQCPALPHGRQI